MGSRLYGDKQWKWIIERYKEGYSREQLAEFLDISVYTVRTHINKEEGTVFQNRCGKHKEKKLKPLKERKQEFYKLYENDFWEEE